MFLISTMKASCSSKKSTNFKLNRYCHILEIPRLIKMKKVALTANTKCKLLQISHNTYNSRPSIKQTKYLAFRISVSVFAFNLLFLFDLENNRNTCNQYINCIYASTLGFTSIFHVSFHTHQFFVYYNFNIRNWRKPNFPF